MKKKRHVPKLVKEEKFEWGESVQGQDCEAPTIVKREDEVTEPDTLEKTHTIKVLKESPIPHFSFYKCITCHYQTKSESAIALHSRRHKSNVRSFRCYRTVPFYLCHVCNFRTSRFLYFSQHHECSFEKTSDDANPPYYCYSCGFKCHSSLILLRHSKLCQTFDGHFMSREHRKEYYKCYQFLTQIQHSNIEWLKCVKCSFMSRLVGNSAKHMKDMHSNVSKIRWFECDKCLVNVKQIFHLRQHVLKKHGESVGELDY